MSSDDRDPSAMDDGGKLVCVVRESAETGRLWSRDERSAPLAAGRRLADGTSDDPAGDEREFLSWALPALAAIRDDSRSWWCNGIRVADDFSATLAALPANQWNAAISGAEAVARSIAARCPDLERVIESADSRREGGRIHAEEMLAGLERKTARRREWIVATFAQVRPAYGAGAGGDQYARKRVASLHRKTFGKSISDRTIARHLKGGQVEKREIAPPRTP